MKYSKTGILKKKVGPASDILQEEAKRMEEKLSELKEFMQKEKEKRDSAPKLKDGSKWRSAAANKPISGYADLVLSQKPKVASNPKQKTQNPSVNFISDPPKKDTEDEIFSFLSSCGLEKYHKLLIDNGIEELDILLELTEEHLADLNIPLGHRLKILKKIKETKDKENNSRLVSEKQDRPESVQSEKPELEETDHADMFKEAIDNYTKAGSPTKHKVKSKTKEDLPKKVRFSEPVTEEMLPKDVKGLLYEESWPKSKSQNPETFEESSATSVPVLIKEKKICWNCYKVFEAAFLSRFMDKEFCCKTCRDTYVESRSEVCVCKIKFVKDQGLIESGVWVCSEKCAQMVLREIQDEPLETPLVDTDENEDLSEDIKIDPITGDVLNI